jgi:hypothetical protein
VIAERAADLGRLVGQSDEYQALKRSNERLMEHLELRVQAHPAYQGVVAAQANFDKLMMKVNEWILDGIRKGADSRIITLG